MPSLPNCSHQVPKSARCSTKAAIMNLPTHNGTCHAIGCQIKLPTAHFACGKHWRFVPNDLKREIGRMATAEGFPDYDENFRRLSLQAIFAIVEAEADNEVLTMAKAAEALVG